MALILAMICTILQIMINKDAGINFSEAPIGAIGAFILAPLAIVFMILGARYMNFDKWKKRFLAAYKGDPKDICRHCLVRYFMEGYRPEDIATGNFHDTDFD